MVSIDKTPLTPDDVKVKQRSGLYPVKVPYSWFPTVRLVEKRSFFPRCLRFQGFLNLKVYYVLHRFAFQVAIGGKNTKEKLIQAISWQGQIAQYVSLVSAVPATQLQALAEALEVNKTLRSLTVAAPWESIGCQALRTAEEMKRGRGDDFRFISADEKEAEGCWGLRSR